MIKRTMTFERPNTSVEFYKIDPDIEKYREDTFVKTGKMIIEKDQISEDGLVLTLQFLYKDIDSLEEFLEDPKCGKMTVDRKRYNLKNKIRVRLQDTVL